MAIIRVVAAVVVLALLGWSAWNAAWSSAGLFLATLGVVSPLIPGRLSSRIHLTGSDRLVLSIVLFIAACVAAGIHGGDDKAKEQAEQAARSQFQRVPLPSRNGGGRGLPNGSSNGQQAASEQMAGGKGGDGAEDPRNLTVERFREAHRAGAQCVAAHDAAAGSVMSSAPPSLDAAKRAEALCSKSFLAYNDLFLASAGGSRAEAGGSALVDCVDANSARWSANYDLASALTAGAGLPQDKSTEIQGLDEKAKQLGGACDTVQRTVESYSARS